MNRTVSTILMSMLMFAVAVTLGCGSPSDPTVKWSGTVTIEGQPIPSDALGVIIVRSNSATGATRGVQAEIINGAYTLQSVPQGEVTVSFDIYKLVPAKDKMDAERGIEEKNILVPDRWAIGVTDTADKNDSAKNFDLTK